MNNKDRLEKVSLEIAKCKICKEGKIGKPVPGEGNPSARIMFIGEAPGRKEAESGRPFVGRSGQLLRNLIRESGLLETDVFITSPVKYLPKRGTPSIKDIRHGRTHLINQIEIINPTIMVLLGSTACKGVLEEAFPILTAHGKIIKRDGRSYLVTLHPAAVLRFPKYKPLIKDDFAKLKALL